MLSCYLYFSGSETGLINPGNHLIRVFKNPYNIHENTKFTKYQLWVAQFAQVKKTKETTTNAMGSGWMKSCELHWTLGWYLKFTNLKTASQIVFLRPKVPNLGWWKTWNRNDLLKSFSSACLVTGLLPIVRPLLVSRFFFLRILRKMYQIVGCKSLQISST